MKIIDADLLDQITKQAKENTRKRMNYNFHASLESNVQRLLNALEPGTNFPIHRHPHTAETYILVRGSIHVSIYNDAKEVLNTIVLNPVEGQYGIDIPAGQWHSLEVLESGTVIFEVKEGPYRKVEDDDILF